MPATDECRQLRAAPLRSRAAQPPNFPTSAYGVAPSKPRTVALSTAGLNCGSVASTRARAVDHGRHAGVRRAQQVAARFGGAHLRDLQMLVRRDRVAEPRVVAHVDEQRRVGQVAQLLGAEHVLVADRHRDLLARGVDQRADSARRP